jgi:predicted lipid-binding transport protein (Tim44 family)
MKKGILTMLALAVFFAFSASAVDAKPRGGIKSPKQSFTQTPAKPADNVTQSNPGSKSTGSTTGATTTANRGFFSGGSFMKGLMIGGLAGLLFGGLFGNLGFFGDLLGLIVNVFALFVLFAVIRAVFVYFRNRRRPSHPDNRRTF